MFSSFSLSQIGNSLLAIPKFFKSFQEESFEQTKFKNLILYIQFERIRNVFTFYLKRNGRRFCSSTALIYPWIGIHTMRRARLLAFFWGLWHLTRKFWVGTSHWNAKFNCGCKMCIIDWTKNYLFFSGSSESFSLFLRSRDIQSSNFNAILTIARTGKPSNSVKSKIVFIRGHIALAAKL